MTAKKSSGAPRGPVPYKFDGTLYNTGADLASALANDPAKAHEHLKAGYVSKWLAEELRDYDAQLMLDKVMQANPGKLVVCAHLYRHFHPDKPIVLQGVELTRKGLLATLEEWGDAKELLYEFYAARILSLAGDLTGDKAIAELEEAWRKETMTYFTVMAQTWRYPELYDDITGQRDFFTSPAIELLHDSLDEEGIPDERLVDRLKATAKLWLLEALLDPDVRTSVLTFGVVDAAMGKNGLSEEGKAERDLFLKARRRRWFDEVAEEFEPSLGRNCFLQRILPLAVAETVAYEQEEDRLRSEIARLDGEKAELAGGWSELRASASSLASHLRRVRDSEDKMSEIRATASLALKRAEGRWALFWACCQLLVWLAFVIGFFSSGHALTATGLVFAAFAASAAFFTGQRSYREMLYAAMFAFIVMWSLGALLLAGSGAALTLFLLLLVPLLAFVALRPEMLMSPIKRSFAGRKIEERRAALGERLRETQESKRGAGGPVASGGSGSPVYGHETVSSAESAENSRSQTVPLEYHGQTEALQKKDGPGNAVVAHHGDGYSAEIAGMHFGSDGTWSTRIGKDMAINSKGVISAQIVDGLTLHSDGKWSTRVLDVDIRSDGQVTIPYAGGAVSIGGKDDQGDPRTEIVEAIFEDKKKGLFGESKDGLFGSASGDKKKGFWEF